MEIDLTIKNYRCFPTSNPAKFTLRKGFTSFLGINNSGKSSLLKFFYELRGVFQAITASPSTFIGTILGNGCPFAYPITVLDREEIFSNTNDDEIQIEIQYKPDGTYEKQADYIPNNITLIIPRAQDIFQAKFTAFVNVGTSDFTSAGLIIRSRSTGVSGDFTPYFQACKLLSETLYVPPFRNALNLGALDNYYDIRTGQGFIHFWDNLKNGPVIKDRNQAIRLTDDIKSIFGYKHFEINPQPGNDTLVLVIDGSSFKLNEIGSGITQFILVLANAAWKAPSFILIDEPESNLHPSLQLDFLTTLASYAKEGVLFATHSIGLARASSERIYSVSRVAEGESKLADYEATPNLSEFLGSLSFSSYQELGFEKILLVEGVTEVKTIQQLLRLYQKEHQIVLLPLCGTNLINPSRELELWSGSDSVDTC